MTRPFRAKALHLELTKDAFQPEAAEAFRKWRGIGQKGHFLYDQNQTILCRSRADFWKYGVSMTSEMAFIESLLLQKRHFQEILFFVL